MVYKARAEVDMSLRRFRSQYEQLSQFERRRIIGMMEAGWSARRVVRQLGHPDCGCRARRNWTEANWNQVVFNDESRFNLSSDDNRVRVWRPHGDRHNPAFALQRHIAPTAGVMVWGAIVYNTRPSLVLICDTIAERYDHDTSCNGSQEPFFNKTMIDLTSEGCRKTVSTLLLPLFGLPDLQICLQ
ncbi:transposable element Tcb1 transposase [Trichonephila clavipes]|nr:transposable element Tcb1 transposase [Trichonephila clavipes]